MAQHYASLFIVFRLLHTYIGIIFLYQENTVYSAGYKWWLFGGLFYLQGDLLKTLGDKHPLYDFMGTLSMKCSYLLFNKEYVKEILVEASTKVSAGDVKFISSCMSLLAVKFPSLCSLQENIFVTMLKFRCTCTVAHLHTS